MFPVNNARVRLAAAILPLIFLFTVSSGCGDETTPTGGEVPSEISGALVDATGCKENIYGMGPGAPTVMDCVFWEWDGADTLSLVHVNAGLNCCPGTISGIIEPMYYDVPVEGQAGADPGLMGFTITETEGDDAIICRCLCLYDLSYKISGIKDGGIFEIRFIEQYIAEGDEILSCNIDLDEQPTGTHCVNRGNYPWTGIYSGEEPAGMIDSYFGCKEVTGTGESFAAFNPDSQCVTVNSHPDMGMLTIECFNTAYNCCVDELDAEFTFEEGLITITGLEHPEGGLCDCICLYDIYYTLYNIDPGIYTIRFIDPYQPQGEEVLEIEVDASQWGSSSACVPRETWPWGELSDEDRDKAKLNAMYDEIVEYIGTPYCTGEEDCRSVGIGSKPCGGPWHYLVYSASTVDESYLMSLVSEHAAFEDYMNMKYGYISTCDVPPAPQLECSDGICRAAGR